MKISVTGLNHNSAPIAVRELLAFRPEELARALNRLREEFGLDEAVILSTCNRVEIYGAGLDAPPAQRAVTGFLSAFHALPLERFAFTVYHRQGPEAVAHLLRVAAGLDSLVLGETQILGQVKEAYRAAHRAGATGAVLNPLFQRCFAVAKEIHTVTDLGRGKVSLSSVAVDIAAEIFRDFSAKTVLIIGAGETAELTLKHLAARGIGRVLVANRSPEKAAAIAGRFDGRALPLPELEANLSQADIVIASTDAAGYLVGPEAVRRARRERRSRPMYLIDLSVPRDIHPEAGELENVFLFNVDDLREMAERNLNGRRSDQEASLAIIRERAEALAGELRTGEVAELLHALTRRCAGIGDEEGARLSRRLGELSEGQRAEVVHALNRTINRILHEPLKAVREDARRHSAAGLAEALRRLFSLNSPPPPPPAEPRP